MKALIIREDASRVEPLNSIRTHETRFATSVLLSVSSPVALLQQTSSQTIEENVFILNSTRRSAHFLSRS